MATPFQIIPATPAETAEILGLERLCHPTPWDEPLIRAFLVAASLPNKGYFARFLKEKDAVKARLLAAPLVILLTPAGESDQ